MNRAGPSGSAWTASPATGLRPGRALPRHRECDRASGSSKVRRASPRHRPRRRAERRRPPTPRRPPPVARPLPDRFDQAVPQRAELEEVEELPHLLAVPAAHPQRVDVDVARHVADEGCRFGVHAHLRLRGSKVLPQLGRELVEAGEDPVEVAVLVDELGRRLLADAGNTGQVVARITSERGVDRVLRRGDARAFEDAGLVVQGVVADASPVVQNLDVAGPRPADSCHGRR